jgi:hypothetical protein
MAAAQVLSRSTAFAQAADHGITVKRMRQNQRVRRAKQNDGYAYHALVAIVFWAGANSIVDAGLEVIRSQSALAVHSN